MNNIQIQPSIFGVHGPTREFLPSLGPTLLTVLTLAYMLLFSLICGAVQAAELPYLARAALPIRATVIAANNGAPSAIQQQGARIFTLAKRDEGQGHEITSVWPVGDLDQDLRREISAKWADLEVRLQSEEAILAECRAGQNNCSAAGRRFFEIVELGRRQEGRARLGAINRAVNMSIRPVSDRVQYGVDDFWSAPLATLDAGAGDCEDYAILKYVALREAGISPDDLRLLIVWHPRRGTTHAVLTVRLDEEWFILDNLTLTIVNAAEATHYRRLFALDVGLGVVNRRLAVHGIQNLE
jgi:predicted transglutaminase-like cysteine proteinase